MNQIGILLNNIGSPVSYQPEDVGKYLKEFLMDKEIIDLPFFLRFFLVHFLIVPRRKFLSAKKYQKIWGSKKSPLVEISEDFSQRLQSQLGKNYFVQLGMNFGQPSVKEAVENMKAKGIQKIIFVPLYPQYARATTLASENKVKAIAKKVYGTIECLSFLPPFYNLNAFIHLSADKLKKDWQTKKWQHVLFSFHGLPESQVKKNAGCSLDDLCCQRSDACASNCYRAQCLKTAEQIAREAGLTKDQYTICFQSRLGSARWMGPATSEVVRELAQKGCHSLLVQTPSFVVDCLETLEEIALELNEQFLHQGGKQLKLVECLNQDIDWVQKFAEHLQAR